MPKYFYCKGQERFELFAAIYWLIKYKHKNTLSLFFRYLSFFFLTYICSNHLSTIKKQNACFHKLYQNIHFNFPDKIHSNLDWNCLFCSNSWDKKLRAQQANVQLIQRHFNKTLQSYKHFNKKSALQGLILHYPFSQQFSCLNTSSVGLHRKGKSSDKKLQSEPDSNKHSWTFSWHVEVSQNLALTVS